VKIDFAGDDLGHVSNAAQAVYMTLATKYGFGSIQPSPNNFNLPGPELQVMPNRRQLSDLGMTPADLGLAVQALGDGAIVGEYRTRGDSIDLKVIAQQSVGQTMIDMSGGGLPDTPIATPGGPIVPISSLATVRRVTSPPQINRVDRQRAVTLQFTAPPTLPLEQAITEIDQTIAGMRDAGAIPPDVESGYTGSASKLRAVKEVLLGDGTLPGILGSSLFLALVITYLLLCVLYQSFVYPLVIMFSVPLATLGGFAALALVHWMSVNDPLLPVQNLDVLAMLGFVILIGVVVNNAILLVHQALNLMKGLSDVEGLSGPLPRREAVTESVRTRVRPILMSLFTSVVGMLPLVVSPGAGSELYRGLGAVVLGGLLVSTVFTLVLIPLLLSLVLNAQATVAAWMAGRKAPALALTTTVDGRSIHGESSNGEARGHAARRGREASSEPQESGAS
jgi:HAE1 family hydrophobic/amphiphilic exporter-1